MPELISVRKPLSSYDHNLLRNHIPETNGQLPDHASVKWLKVGHVALTVLERGEFEAALSQPGGELANLSLEEIQAIMEEKLRPDPRAPGMLNTKTLNTDFMGLGEFARIAYILDSPEVLKQRQKVTELLDNLNAVGTNWREFIPHVSIATVDKNSKDESVLKVFETIRPAQLNFRPTKAEIS